MNTYIFIESVSLKQENNRTNTKKTMTQRYTFLALSPFTTMERGQKRSFSAGESFTVNSDEAAKHYMGDTSPYASRVILIEKEGDEEVKESKAKAFYDEVEKMTEPTESAKNVTEQASEIEVQPSGQKLVSESTPTLLEKPEVTTEESSEQAKVIRRKK